AHPARHDVRTAGRAHRRVLPGPFALQRRVARLSARLGHCRRPGAADCDLAVRPVSFGLGGRGLHPVLFDRDVDRDRHDAGLYGQGSRRRTRITASSTMGEAERASPLPGVMPGRTPENAPQPADFKPAAVGKELLRSIRAGTLATLDRNTGHPFASLVNVAGDADGSPLILVSRLSTHTANLEHDGRASILLAETGKGDPLAHPRLTVLGTMAPVDRNSADDARVRRRFLARH